MGSTGYIGKGIGGRVTVPTGRHAELASKEGSTPPAPVKLLRPLSGVFLLIVGVLSAVLNLLFLLILRI